MANNDDNGFSNGLGVMVAIVGAFIGIGVASDDPEMNSFVGFLVGGFIGYVLGRIVGSLLTFVFKVIIAILSGLFILFRIYRFITFLAE